MSQLLRFVNQWEEQSSLIKDSPIRTTRYGVSFRLLPPTYLKVIEEKMPLDVITANGHISNCGFIIVHSLKNEFFDCYEVIDDEEVVNEILSAI